jgi:excisionase family DNA binding protein
MDIQTATPSAPVALRLSVREAAQYIGLSKTFLDHRRISGNGPTFLKVGGRVLYERDALDAWLASCRRQSTSQEAA